MTARRANLSGLPDWPRLMSVDQAAAYLGLSAPTFTDRCKVHPCKIGARTLYDRRGT